MSVLEKTVQRLVAALEQNGYQFAIVSPDGEKIGELEVCEPKNKRGANRNHGITSYVRSCIRGMNIGEIRRIDPMDYEPQAVSGVMSYSVAKEFGEDAEVSVARRDDGVTEVMRL